ncbi:MAG TPA: metal ABC transporter ATP-binding protein [Dissulfurispiraceae bacterium]|nr:metal ABC transporter ATP-binding protein [Dissulfurispiraceae bacterium]
MSETALSVSHLSFAYTGTPVLSDIRLDIAQGDYVGLVGPNGSGKSTFIRAILGLVSVPPDTVRILGIPLERFADWDKIGYLPQQINHINPFFPANVEEIVRLGTVCRKGSAAQNRGAAVFRALSLLGIEDLGKKMIGELSGGQQQRVFIARAVVNNPSLLILDEPTAALDPDTRERFYALLQSLNREQGTTIILVTHDIGTIGRYAKRLLYLDKQVVFYGGFDDFCRSDEMSKFFGDYSQHIICHRHDTDHQHGND